MDKFYLRYWNNFPEAGKLYIKTNYLAWKFANFTWQILLDKFYLTSFTWQVLPDKFYLTSFTWQILPDKFYLTSFTMGNLTQKGFTLTTDRTT
jgi:hypothetical protein